MKATFVILALMVATAYASSYYNNYNSGGYPRRVVGYNGYNRPTYYQPYRVNSYRPYGYNSYNRRPYNSYGNNYRRPYNSYRPVNNYHGNRFYH